MRQVQVNIPYKLLLARQGEILAMGLNPEIYMDGEALDTATKAEMESIASGFAEKGRTVTLHGPYMDLSPGGADEMVRRATMDRFCHAMETARIYGASAVVLHGGYDERHFDGDAALWLKQSLKTWPVVIDLAERTGVAIAVENVFDSDPSALKALLAELGSPHFGICLDIGHINIFSRVPMEEWFKEVGPHIRHVHIHDNHGSSDEHLPIGGGDIDFDLFFKLLEEYSPGSVYTIEPHGEEYLEPGLRNIQKYL